MMSRLPNIETRTCGFSNKLSSTIFLSFSTDGRTISSTFYIRQISVANDIYYFVCCCVIFHFLFPFSLHAAPCTGIYPDLPFAVQERLDTAVKSMRIPSAESLMHEISIPNLPLRIGRASKVMDHAGEFFGSTPLHDPQDAASILQNSIVLLRKVYPAS